MNCVPPWARCAGITGTAELSEIITHGKKALEIQVFFFDCKSCQNEAGRQRSLGTVNQESWCCSAVPGQDQIEFMKHGSTAEGQLVGSLIDGARFALVR